MPPWANQPFQVRRLENETNTVSLVEAPGTRSRPPMAPTASSQGWRSSVSQAAVAIQLPSPSISSTAPAPSSNSRAAAGAEYSAVRVNNRGSKVRLRMGGALVRRRAGGAYRGRNNLSGPPSLVILAAQNLLLHGVQVGVGLGHRGEDLVHRHRLDHVEDLLDLRLRIDHHHLAA